MVLLRKVLLGLMVLLVCGAAVCVVVAILRGDARFYLFTGLFGIPVLPLLFCYLIVAAWTAMNELESGMKRAAHSLNAEFAFDGKSELDRLIAPFSITKLSGARFYHEFFGKHQTHDFYAATFRHSNISNHRSEMIPLIVLPNGGNGIPDFRLTPRTILGHLLHDSDYPQEVIVDGSHARDGFARLFVLEARAKEDAGPLLNLVVEPMLERTEWLRGWSLELRAGVLLVYRKTTLLRDFAQLTVSVEKRTFRSISETLKMALEVAGIFSQSLS